MRARERDKDRERERKRERRDWDPADGRNVSETLNSGGLYVLSAQPFCFLYLFLPESFAILCLEMDPDFSFFSYKAAHKTSSV